MYIFEAYNLFVVWGLDGEEGVGDDEWSGS